MSSRSGAAREAAGLAVGLVVAVATVWMLFAVVALTTDLHPPGPECDYELRPASASGTLPAEEELRWGLLTDRVCRHDGDPPQSSVDIVSFLAAASVAVVAGGAAGWGIDRTLRRRAGRDRGEGTDP